MHLWDPYTDGPCLEYRRGPVTPITSARWIQISKVKWTLLTVAISVSSDGGWPNVPYMMPYTWYMPPGCSLQPGATHMASGQPYFYGEPYVHLQQQPTMQPAHQDQHRPCTWQPQPLTRAADPDRKEPPRIPTIPKSMLYDGRGSWQGFYTKFMKFSNMHHWNRTERRDHLRRCLEGESLLYYSSVRPGWNHLFRDLIAKMEHRFGTKDSPEKVVNVPETVNVQETADILFNTAEQEADESLDEWADRVQTLAITVYSALPEYYIAKQCALRFCRGAQKREAGETVAHEHPAKLEEALDKLKWVIYKRSIRAKEEAHQSPEISSDQATVTITGVTENSLESRLGRCVHPTIARSLTPDMHNPVSPILAKPLCVPSFSPPAPSDTPGTSYRHRYLHHTRAVLRLLYTIKLGTIRCFVTTFW